MSQRVYPGGIFVDREVEDILKKRLNGSRFSDKRVINIMKVVFETAIKGDFNGIENNYSLRFGSTMEHDPSVGINNGKITLSNQDLQPAFDHVINQIINGCFESLLKQRAKYVILVGGLADSPYVRHRLWKALDNHNIEIIPGGDSANKAAAEGAVIALIKQFVIARAVKATFGGCIRPLYDKKLHRERKHTVKVYPDGKQRMDGAFHPWVTKGTVLRGTFAHKLSYHVAWEASSTSTSDLRSSLGTIGIEVFSWEEDGTPTWCKDEHGLVMKGMRRICTLNADLSALAGGLQIKSGPRGTSFYRVDYEVCVYFGGTQLRAKLQWKEEGVLHEGPVTVMPYLH